MRSKPKIVVVSATVLTLVLVVALALVGISGPSSPNVVKATDPSCTITWNDPTGVYQSGSTETASVSATSCGGTLTWTLTCTSGGSACVGAASANSGGPVNCPSPCSMTMFSTMLPAGSYAFSATLAGSAHSSVFSVTGSVFFVVPESPFGVIGLVLASVGGIAAFALMRGMRAPRT
jgi:hypothetical protein